MIVALNFSNVTTWKVSTSSGGDKPYFSVLKLQLADFESPVKQGFQNNLPSRVYTHLIWRRNQANCRNDCPNGTLAQQGFRQAKIAQLKSKMVLMSSGGDKIPQG